MAGKQLSMERTILSFDLDSESEWFAELSCGHRQHTRHNPPIQEREWVKTAVGRDSRIGTSLACVLCDRSELPNGFSAYNRTPTFSETSVPKALLGTHSTKPAVWGLIHVVEGQLTYNQHAPYHTSELLTPSAPGIVRPEVEHHVTCDASVQFYVEFWRRERVRV
jgi:tellurite methyltransferase